MAEETQESLAENMGPVNLNYGPFELKSASGDPTQNMSASLRLFENNNEIPPGIIQVMKEGDNYRASFDGAYPLQANLGGLQTEGLTLNHVAVGSGGLESLQVQLARLAMGQQFEITNAQLSLSGSNGNWQVTAGGASGELMGHAFTAAGVQLNLDSNGSFVDASFDSVSGEGMELSGGRLTPEGLQIASAGLQLPEVLGQSMTADFTDLNITSTGATGAGVLRQDSTLALLGGKLQVSGLVGAVNLSADSWMVDVAANADFQDGAHQVTGLLARYTANGESTNLAVEGGSWSSTVGPFTFSGTGLSYDTTSDQLNIATAELLADLEQFQMQGTGNGLRLGPNGFEFDSIQMNTLAPVDLLPGLSVASLSGELRKEGEGFAFDAEGQQIAMNYGAATGTVGALQYYYNSTGSSIEAQSIALEHPALGISVGSLSHVAGQTTLGESQITVRNIGNAGDIVASSEGMEFTEAGLRVTNFSASLPEFGGVAATATAAGITLGDSLAVEGGTLDLAGEISLLGGALTVTNPSSTFDYAETGWQTETQGTIGLNVPNTTASGELKVSAGAEGTEMELLNGQIDAEIAGVGLSGTGVSYSSETDELNVDQVQITASELLEGGDLQATATGIKFNQSGFDFQTIDVSSSGAMELLPGFTVSAIDGLLSKNGESFDLALGADATVALGTINGSAEVDYTYENGQSTIELPSLQLSAGLFSFETANLAYENGQLSIDTVDLNLENLGSIAGSLTASASGIVYSSAGLSIDSMSADFPDLAGTGVSVLVENFNVAAGGAVSGSGTVNLASDIVLAGGSATLSDIESSVDFSGSTWGVSIGAGLAFQVAGVEASGQVDVNYASNAGLGIKIRNSRFDAGFAGFEASSKEMSYEATSSRFVVDSPAFSFPNFADGLETEAESISMEDGDLKMEDVKVTLGYEWNIREGIVASLDEGALNKDGGSTTLTAVASLNIDLPKYSTTGSAAASLEVSLSDGNVEAALDSLSLDNAIVNLTVGADSKLTENGFYFSEVTLGISEDADYDTLKEMFPAFGGLGAMAINALKGSNVVATGVNVSRANGFEAQDISLDFAKIPFQAMGMEGELDINNLSAKLGGSKEFKLEDFGIPTSVGISVPIVAGINATGEIGIDAGIKLGANIQAQGNKDSDVWELMGGIDADGALSVYIQAGVEVDAWVAGAGAAIRAAFNTDLDISAGIGMAITYNPDTKSVEMVHEGITFDYRALAEIYTSLSLVLHGHILGWETEEVIELARWDIGILDAKGDTEGNSLGELLGNFSNSAKLMTEDDEYNLI
ncbi:hypothetical protein [Saprospira grandis]|uniref:Uncharacterized protein n=1 Tax=Saprospira grandis (strain Lewin) TaxID=984262 RepID=H6LAG8_SAPGL|nr:hypothetical protein [Saprospira grandis]AFC25561.1 hypothetical protein SGRA_2833 [Saprospira grandis str. Lewin]